MTEPRTVDILLSQRFLPEPGGSIRWMYEVYSRWPQPVEVITHDYYNYPPNTPEFAQVPAPPNGRDHVTDDRLLMDRRDIFINDWGLESPHRLRRVLRMTAAVRERLRRCARSGQTLRVHCTHAVPEVVSLLPLKWLYGKRLQIISYAHGEEVTACCASRQLKFLMRRANAAVDLMIANSRYTTTVLDGHIDPSKVSVVNPGVRLDEFEPANELGRHWRQANGFGDRVIVLTLGRMDPRKNHAAVIEAVAQLADRFPNLLYVAAGQGREQSRLKARADQLGIADRIVFPGSVDGPTKLALFGACDVFAMPAIRDGTDVEGFGMVFLEAGACGKPCVAGCEGGQAEAVIDGHNGSVIDGTDRRAVTSAIERLLRNPAERDRMGRAGLAKAAEHDWPKVVQRTVELVEKLEEGQAVTP